MDAGQRLFASRSKEGVSIDEIVDAANVAKGSFYNHFSDKESLADAIVELVQGDCEHHVFVANQDVEDSALRVVRALAVLIQYVTVHPDRLGALLTLTSRKVNIAAPLNAGLTHDIRQGLDSGRFSGISVECGVLSVLGLIGTAVDFVGGDRGGIPLEQVVEEMGSVLLRGLGIEHEEASALAHQAVELLENLGEKS
tara:strand:- start:27845 stop:28435 length:591 start_codon:yes stop_codon:yes gene_type:complete